MAESITIKALQDASLDAKSLEEVVNGNEVKQVTTRLGENYPSVKKAINTMFENGGLPATPFKTKALMTASSLVNDNYAMVTDDTVNNGLYVKTAGAWVKSGYDPVARANAYTDTAKSEAIDSAVAYTDEKIDEIYLATTVLTGQELYSKSLIDVDKPFSAIWSEYNKPVWHTGNGVFIDAVGAKVKVVEEELVLTLVATETNQEFRLPIAGTSTGGKTLKVDWGDGVKQDALNYVNNVHTYECEIGDTFTFRLQGEVLGFGDFVGSSGFTAMIKSIDKNTLPKTMTKLNLGGFINLTSACDGAFSSYSGTTLPLLINRMAPNLELRKDIFAGLSQVTDISRLLGDTSNKVTMTIPPNTFDHFKNATKADELFYGISTPVPVGILDKLVNLESVYRMFKLSTITSLDENIFKYQDKLKNVGEVFNDAQSLVADAELLYNDMKRGNPTNTSGCFTLVLSMTNVSKVPAGWK